MRRIAWGWGLLGLCSAGCGDDAGGGGETAVSGESTTAADSTSTEGTSDDPATSVDSTGTTTSESTTSDDGGSSSSGGEPSCPYEPAAADRDRFVVISQPYTADSRAAAVYEVLALSQDGELATTGTTFEMGRARGGTIAFTPDGAIGLVAQDDGTVGVFRIDASGTAEVLEAAFAGDFYASTVVMAPDGQRIFVLDTQTADNGGGLHEIAIDCDDQVTEVGRALGGDLFYDLAWRADGSALVGARGLAIGTMPGHNAFLVDGVDAPAVLSSVAAFPDDESIMTAVVLAAGGQVGLIADNSSFSGVPNRIAVVAVDGDTLTAVQVVPDLNDPYDLVASPVDDTALMISGFGDAAFVLDIDPQSPTPVTIRGELAYDGASPQLPGHAVMIEQGSLRGLVLLAELSGVRRIQFEGGGVVTDLGLFDLGEDIEQIVGAVGVQP